MTPAQVKSKISYVFRTTHGYIEIKTKHIDNHSHLHLYLRQVLNM